jgi:hypothetical protein
MAEPSGAWTEFSGVWAYIPFPNMLMAMDPRAGLFPVAISVFAAIGRR